ncbi:MAG: response regulator [Bacteroidetes bacterium]|nr:response regulator [Bacteroidota bacterium]
MIFLVDDDEIQNLINSKVISIVNPNITVDAYLGAERALAALEEGRQPKIIFLDINMPKLNGWDFLEIYQTKYQIPVYMLSSSINVKDKEKSETYPVVKGFICKPLVVEKLREILRENSMV